MPNCTKKLLYMRSFLLFFTKPVIGGALSLIGLLEILFSIPSSYLTYQISLWIIVLVVGIIILFHHFWKRIKILYYIKTYTSDSFGGSYMYKWHWVRSSFYTNVYGYFPDCIDVMETTKLNPNIPVIDCVHHYIENKDLLQEYIMLSLYNKVENTKQTNLFMQQLHHLEEHYSKQRNSI